MAKIIYTHTDEAPMLATYSFLPIIEAFASTAGVEVETRDISLAGRIIAAFGDYLTEEQRVSDALAELGALAKKPEANIIKLPNISASDAAVEGRNRRTPGQGLRAAGLPGQPLLGRGDGHPRPATTRSRAPPSTRSCAKATPTAAPRCRSRTTPARTRTAWAPGPPESKTNVATMDADDFRSNEKSVVIEADDNVKIQLVKEDGTVKVLKRAFPVLAGEVIDGTVMRAAALDAFLAAQVARAKEEGVLFSAHLKATMMKVSDPIIFGHVVKAYFADLFATYGEQIAAAGLSPNNGLASILNGLEDLPEEIRGDVQAAIEKGLNDGPELAMVDSDKGITNLHVPSDVIVDASMPAMIRSSGHMWGRDGQEADTLAVLPDSSYAGIYQVVIDDCRAHGAFDPTTMGTVPNVGLMAQAAEEYGSHDKTFEIQSAGTVQIVDDAGTVLIEHQVAPGDIWRACQTKDVPIRDWVKLAVTRARASATPAVFWLDKGRAHDARMIAKVEEYLKEHDTEGLEIAIMSPDEATAFTVERLRKGQDTISVTGNVLRDYLTDLFPILELGTSAKMLSVVPLINGGGLFETGAGGSAPKHVQQLLKENHLRWDSLGEFLALAVSFEHLATTTGNARAQVLADTLDRATGTFLLENKSPEAQGRRARQPRQPLLPGQVLGRGAGPPDRRRRARRGLRRRFRARWTPTRKPSPASFSAVQGSPVDIGGYYRPDEAKVSAVMRPSAKFSEVLAMLKK